MNKRNPEPSIHWKLNVGSGKANFELARLTNAEVKVPKHHFLYVIAREEIQSGDFSRLRYEFSMNQHPKTLGSMLGRVTFTVADYDNTEAELFEIPEVRQYFSQLNLHYPCWVPFAAVQTASLRMIAACLAPRLSAIKRAHSTHVDLTLSRDHVTSFYTNAFPLAAAIYHTVDGPSKMGQKQLEKSAKHLGILKNTVK